MKKGFTDLENNKSEFILFFMINSLETFINLSLDVAIDKEFQFGEKCQIITR